MSSELTFGPSVIPDDSICEWERLLVCLLPLEAPLGEGLEVSGTGFGTRLL